MLQSQRRSRDLKDAMNEKKLGPVDEESFSRFIRRLS